MAAPIPTTGPSRPTEPPVAMVRPVNQALSTALEGRMWPSRKAAASITSGTPGPRASGAQKAMTGPTARPPRVGIKILSHQGVASTRAMKCPCPGQIPHCPTSMRARNPRVPTPARAPMTMARSKKRNSLVWWLRFMGIGLAGAPGGCPDGELPEPPGRQPSPTVSRKRLCLGPDRLAPGISTSSSGTSQYRESIQ